MFTLAHALIGSLYILISLSPVQAASRGVPWATDNRFAPNIAYNPRIQWYHHWQDGKVPEMPGKVEYVPMYWGPAQSQKWYNQKGDLNANPPRNIMAFNEPDVPSQSNMDPYYAATLYMQEIQPFANKGTRLGSPAIAFNDNWMNTFLQEVSKQGGHVDFICIHWYGSWNDLAGFQNWVRKVHDRFGKNIWITEVGITTQSGPWQDAVKDFMMNAMGWLDTQGYVERVAWFGGFETNKAPDGFATGLNGFFSPGGQLNQLGQLYSTTGAPAPNPAPPKPQPKPTSSAKPKSSTTSKPAPTRKCKPRAQRRLVARSHHHVARSLH